jgi:hypothetical protein
LFIRWPIAPNHYMLSAKQRKVAMMPRGPKGERRPADVIGNAVKVMRIATGEEPEDYGAGPESEGKDPAAVALGRKGGAARAAALTKRRRSEIARQAAAKRWKD